MNNEVVMSSEFGANFGTTKQILDKRMGFC